MQKPDILQVIKTFIPLIPAGSGRFKCLCPFHVESTPSFTVDIHRQRFRCFGCGENGDSISFIMRLKNLSFVEACNYLNVIREQPDYQQLESDRQVVNSFNFWCRERAHKLHLLLHEIESIKQSIESEIGAYQVWNEELEKETGIIAQLEILDNGDFEDRLSLHQKKGGQNDNP